MSSKQSLRITTPSRLHLGFVDLHGGLGRRFGSVGVALETPCLDVTLREADTLEVTGEECERVRTLAEHFIREQGVGAAHIRVDATIPAHQGFGSGTQTALAVAYGLARLSKVRLSCRELMRVMRRGRRSGIGLAAFELGGLVVDGGKYSDDEPPPLLSRFALPETWRVVLIGDAAASGEHGAGEHKAFDESPVFSSSCAGYLSRVLLMELLPGAAEGDFSAFADATMRLQDCIGDYFAAVQGGRYASPKVARILEHLGAGGIRGLGQSSWGPTGFLFAPDESTAEQWVAMAKQVFPEHDGLDFSIAKIANSGAAVA